MAAATSVHVVAIVEPIIQHADWFFPDGRRRVPTTLLLLTVKLSSLTSSPPTDVDFNVSGMFAMPTPAFNHNNHLDYDCSTVERKRPVSVVVPEGDAVRKDK